MYFSVISFQEFLIFSILAFSENAQCFVGAFLEEHIFLGDTSGRLLLIFRKLHIQTSNCKQICSLDQYCWHAIFYE